MKTIQNTDWSFYIGWFSSGVVSFFITFILSCLPSSIIESIVGDTILVAGKTRITEDYMLAYTFIPLFGIIIGILQYFLLRQRRERRGWWILTTTIGWSLAWLGIGLRYNPLGNVNIPESVWYSMVAGVILGIFIGLAQWVILRKQMPYAVWWIPANMLGFGIAGLVFSNISSLLDPLVGITIPSLTTGIAFWSLLDKLPGDNNNENKPVNPALT